MANYDDIEHQSIKNLSWTVWTSDEKVKMETLSNCLQIIINDRQYDYLERVINWCLLQLDKK